jgi:hypothetical protein
MSSLADIPDLVGFFSYVRGDDARFRGSLSVLREKIQQELKRQLGRDVRLWQDVEDIPIGVHFSLEIQQALGGAVFFIPIVTPRELTSEWSNFEYQRFLEREEELGRKDLIFPILYIGEAPPDEGRSGRNDIVGQVIRTRGFLDWRPHRSENFEAEPARGALARYCRKITDVLRAPWEDPRDRARKKSEDQRAAERNPGLSDKPTVTRPPSGQRGSDIVVPPPGAQGKTQAAASNAPSVTDSKATKIVISYRRKDSQSTTRAIFERLERDFGAASVFMDVNVPIGTDFRKHINLVLKECDVLIAIVGRKWLGRKKAGELRIKEEEDWVKIEIETALRRQIAIIPVLVDGASMPSKAQLPPSIQDFTYHNAAHVDTGRDFSGHMRTLIDGVRRIVAEGRGKEVVEKVSGS